MKQKVISTLLCLFVMLSAFAVNADDVTMVSYEQGWTDMEGTLALKNNTNSEIRNITFLITYLDMNGNDLDYEEFYKKVSIAPGMTKKIDIPAYEHGRYYHYYKSENMPGGSPAFKIIFELKDYNAQASLGDDESDLAADDDVFDNSSSDRFTGYFIIILLVGLVMFIGISVGLYILVAVMAQHRHRNVVAWILISFVGTPVLSIIILLVIGDADTNDGSIQ